MCSVIYHLNIYMKTNFSRLLALLALCVSTIFLCACSEWFDFGAKPTSRPTAQPTVQPDTLQVHFIDVGQGDAIEKPEGKLAVPLAAKKTLTELKNILKT